MNLFRDLDPIKWRKIDHNPIMLLAEMTPEQLAERAAEMVLYTRINQAHRRLKEYLSNTQHHLGRPRNGRAGFAASCVFLRRVRPARIGADLFGRPGRALRRPYQEREQSGRVRWWRSACFTIKAISSNISTADGFQQEEYQDTRVENLPMEPAIGTDGKQVTVSLETRDGGLMAKVWLMNVGRVPLYLLDCDVEGNSPQDRDLTSRLYGGDMRTRIRQELVLGVGGVKALRRWASCRASIT